MLASITPLGERSRGQRWGVTVAFFLVASTTTGALLGGALGGAGALLTSWWGLEADERLTAAAAVAAAAMLVDLQPFAELPTTRRQVNAYWLDTYRGWVYGGGFGAQLGVGVGTIVTTAGVYAVLVIALLQQAALPGALVVGAFGFARGVSVLPAGVIRDSAPLGSLSAVLARKEHAVRALVIVVYGSAAVFAVAVQQIGGQ